MNAPSWIGRSLGGRYQIEQMLGQGGMSAVYKANDPNLRRVVAVKLIHPHLSGDTRFLHRFEEEAAAVAQLRHPNIIQVFDFNQDSGVYYMVMEFIAGETLQDRLRRYNRSNRFIPLGKAVHYISNICAAIGYAHKRGIIHRDIKPANIMIDVHDQAILMDFGIVKIVGAEKFTATGAVVGTALYLPPEVIRGEAPDARSDIYSLGVTLYEIISGRPPFEADSAMTLMMMHLNDPLPDLASLRPGTPPELVAIVERALAKDRTDRFSSADEFAQALQALLPRLASLDPAGTSSGVSSMPPAQPAAAPAAPQPATEVEPQPQPPQAPKPASPKPAAPKPTPVSTAPAQPVKPPAEPQPSTAATRVTPPTPAANTVQSRPVAETPRGPAHTPAAGAGRPPAGFNLRSPLVLGAGAVILLVLIISGLLLSRGSPPVQQASVNGTPPDEAAISATQPALAAASSTLPAQAAASENSPTPTETNSPTATITLPPTDTPAPTDTPTITPTPTPELFVLIKSIVIENNAYVVDYETFGYTEKIPGMHVHFFYDTVLPEDAGMPGSGPWKLYGGPRPFKDYLVSSRPAQATKMCALVANDNHTVIQNSGTCLELP
jgi:serine/threonine-protein kinase